jgi:DNA-3-methyladenine glycosylase I
MTLKRCTWADGGDTAMLVYHDHEWGVPHHEDSALFELLTLEGAQAGLSWRTILARRDEYRRAYHGFDIARVAVMRDGELEKLLTTSGIIRNRLKVFSVRDNARTALDVIVRRRQADHQSSACREGRAGADRKFGPNEQDAKKARLPLRRVHHMLCIHAGDWNGE